MLLIEAEVLSVGSKVLETVFVVCLKKQFGCSEVRDCKEGQMKTDKFFFHILLLFFIKTEMQQLSQSNFNTL